VLHPAPARPELEKLLEKARREGVTDEQLQQQRASFAYGNSPLHNKKVSKESAMKASSRSRLTDA
jgi:hypothetical protein